jgi:hypothetical protein
MARFETTTFEWSWGLDADPLVAHDKAVAEAWERQAYRQMEGAKIVSAPYGALAGAIDPTSMVRYADWQYRQEGFRWQRFDPRGLRDWVSCEQLGSNGRQVWVPVEFVFHRDSLSDAQKARALSRA